MAEQAKEKQASPRVGHNYAESRPHAIVFFARLIDLVVITHDVLAHQLSAGPSKSNVSRQRKCSYT